MKFRKVKAGNYLSENPSENPYHKCPSVLADDHITRNLAWTSSPIQRAQLRFNRSGRGPTFLTQESTAVSCGLSGAEIHGCSLWSRKDGLRLMRKSILALRGTVRSLTPFIDMFKRVGPRASEILRPWISLKGRVPRDHDSGKGGRNNGDTKRKK